MTKKSAGILLYRKLSGHYEVFLVHPGGPFWSNKDYGAWSVPKGEFTEEEEPLNAAIREFEEETGKPISGNFIALTPVKQKSGKIVHAFAIESDFDTSDLQSNLFEMEWPPHSGKTESFPEVDRGDWFNLDEARKKILPGQVPILDELESILNQNNHE